MLIPTVYVSHSAVPDLRTGTKDVPGSKFFQIYAVFGQTNWELMPISKENYGFAIGKSHWHIYNIY